MRLESISAPPPEPSPQMRYASLHRAVEKGIASDETWSELTKVCLALGLHDEALSSFARVESGSERLHLQNLLLRHALVVLPDPRRQEAAETESCARQREELADGLRFLADDTMPGTLIAVTITFPVIVGLWGFLHGSSPVQGLHALLALPAALLLLLVSALLRRTLVEASRGIEDAPRLAAIPRLVHEAARFAIEAGPVLLLTVGPAVALYALGLPLPGVLGALALGLLVLPMTLLLRVVRESWCMLAPSSIALAVCRGGTAYVRLVCILLGLGAPAAAAWFAAGGIAPHLRLALVGPLAVAPLVLAMRMLGRFAHAHPSVVGLETRALADRPVARVRPRSCGRRSVRSASEPTPRYPAPESGVRSTPRPAVAPPRALPPVVTPEGTLVPELAQLPGAAVVTGADRARAGAAAGSRPDHRAARGAPVAI